MRRDVLVLGVAFVLLATGCRTMERLSFIRPSATRGDYTQVAPTYEVSDKGRKGATVGAGQLLVNATALYRAGRIDEAGELARKALKTDPKSGDAHTLLAAIAGARGDAAGAGKHYQQAVALSPAEGAYANNYGTWLCSNGRAAESLSWFDKAVADPEYGTRAAALANAGTCAHRTGQLDLAEAYWRQALALEPTEMQSLAGMANLQFARARYLEARAFAERWLGIAPSDREALQLASQIELKLGDTDASTRYLQRLQALSPGAINAPRSQ